MKAKFACLFYFLCHFLCAQETRDWNVGVSYGVGGSNVFLLPAVELDYKKNMFSIAPSRNTLALACFRDFKYFGKKKNFTWIGSAVFIADFMPKKFLFDTIWTPDYYTRPLDIEGRYIYILQSGIKANFLKRCYFASQVGVAMLDYTNISENDFRFAMQFHLGLRLFKHSFLNK
jgi:hypothetical protein